MTRLFEIALLFIVLTSGCLDNLTGIAYPTCDDAESDGELCEGASATCGSLTIADRCGELRTVQCGECLDPNSCGGGGEDNVCGCSALDDTAYCNVGGAECGTITGVDPCGNPRAVTCGQCGEKDTCIGNKCVCEAVSDDELCMRNSAECGTLTVTDACSEMREIDCGGCEDGTCTDENRCSCEAETDEELCASYNLNCGTAPGPLIDRCGESRTDVECGNDDCSDADGAGLECEGGGTPNRCGCPDSNDTTLCQMADATCGDPVVMDACGERQVSCGTCTEPDTCGGGEADEFECGCENESPEQYCERLGLACGTVADPVDICGDPITEPVDCGECELPEQCGVNAPNRCTCVPESPSELCMAEQAVCGTISVTDRCGNTRNPSCGTCASGLDCINNNCRCVPETTTQFCTRLNACGTVTDEDNCGITREEDCGQCQSGTCNSDNKCSNCTPQSNQSFCNDNNATCGSVTAPDNCGETRTVECGTCTSPFQCQSGMNSCVCVSPTTYPNACANVECGLHDYTDVCNNTVEVDCGTCDGAGEQCQSGACVCVPESVGQLCGVQQCGSRYVTDRCGDSYTVNCGSCGGILGCVLGQCTL